MYIELDYSYISGFLLELSIDKGFFSLTHFHLFYLYHQSADYFYIQKDEREGQFLPCEPDLVDVTDQCMGKANIVSSFWQRTIKVAYCLYLLYLIASHRLQRQEICILFNFGMNGFAFPQLN